MTSKYTTVFFDWGGVIANDPGDEFLGDLIKSVGASDAQVQEIFETYMKRFMRGQISEAEYWQELRAKYGLLFMIQSPKNLRSGGVWLQTKTSWRLQRN